MASTNNDSVLLKNVRQRKTRRLIFILFVFIAVFVCVFTIGKTVHKFKKYVQKNDQRFEQLKLQFDQIVSATPDMNSHISQRLTSVERSLRALDNLAKNLELSLSGTKRDFTTLSQTMKSVAAEKTKNEGGKANVDIQPQLRSYEKKISWLEGQLVNLGAVVNLLEMQSHDKNDNTNPSILKELTDLKAKIAKNEDLIDQVSTQQLVQETIVENLAKSVSEIQYESQREAKDIEKLHETVEQKLSNVEVDLSLLRASAMETVPHDLDSMEADILNVIRGHAANVINQETEDAKEEKVDKKVEEHHGMKDKKHKEKDDKKKMKEKHHETVKGKPEPPKESLPNKVKNWAGAVATKAKGNFDIASTFINQKAQKGFQDVKRVVENVNVEVKKFFKRLF